MNKTRQEIIELIEPYMDKTIIKWCLIHLDIWTLDEELFYEVDDWTEIDFNNDRVKDLDWHWTIDDVIWHYDITAVLKYIESKLRKESKWPWHIPWKVPCYIIWWHITFDTFNWIFILNKPLILYTEKEEKDLLELLKKLW